MVVAPHRAAAEAGAAVLREGGNALEAMIAAAATIAVVYPHMNGIGGDVFLLVAEPGGSRAGVDACGAAGVARHHRALPRQGLRHGAGAWTGRGADGRRRGLRLGARGRNRRSTRRPHIAARAARRCGAPGEGGHRRQPLAGADDRGASRRAGAGSRLRRAIPGRRQAAGDRRPAWSGAARRHARPARAQPASTISTAATSARRSPPTSRRSAAR